LILPVIYAWMED